MKNEIQLFEQLVEKISNIHTAMQRGAANAVNQYLSVRNWLFGYYIVEFEQNGEDRAKYGEKLIDELSKSLRTKGIKGVVPTSLRICRTFYLTYPQIQQTLSVILQSVDLKNNLSLPIQPTVPGKLQNAEVYKKDLPPELLLSRMSFSQTSLLVLFFAETKMKHLWNTPQPI